MKVTVIGQWGGFPKKNGASSGYLLESKGFHLLVDCGSAVLSKVQQYVRVEELDAVILSHYHSDHVADIGPLQHARLVNRYMGIQQQELPIYGHTLDEDEFARLTHEPDTLGVGYCPSEILEVGPFQITFQRTSHPVPCFAMRITDGSATVVYTGDSAYIEEFETFAAGADLFICESNFYAGMDGSSAGHMSSSEAATIAQQAKVQQLLLTHLPHFGNVQDLVLQAKEVFAGEVALAEEGWTWEQSSST